MKVRLIQTLGLLLLAGCGSDGNEGAPPVAFVTAAELGDQALVSNRQLLATAEYATADLQRGEKLFGQCRGCHSIESGGMNLLGPNLYGMFQREAGNNENFRYTEAFGSASFYWTPVALDNWLANPPRFLPGNAMSFIGIRNADDRRDLIAWMLSVSESPELTGE